MNIENDITPAPVPTEPSPLFVLLTLALAAFLGTILGSVLAFGWSEAQGVQLQTALYELNNQSERPLRDLVRFVNFLNHIATFLLPAVFVAVFFYRRSWIQYFKLDRLPTLPNLSLGILFVLASFPFVQITYWLNRQLPLPEWARALEENTQNMVEGLLVMNSPGELAFNLLVIAVLPAIGEELVFRGIVQQQFQRVLRNPVTAIWLTAILFSAIHMQFAGFLPRVVLGATLGYLFYWSRSLWVPILAHFFTNGLQVAGQYASGGKLTEVDLDTMKFSNWVMGILSLAVTIALGYYLWKKSRLQQPDQRSTPAL